jgi:hypothetical protein
VSDTEDSEVATESEQEESALSDAPSTQSPDEDSEAEKRPPPVKKATKARAKPAKKEPAKKKVAESKAVAKKASKKAVSLNEVDNEDQDVKAADKPGPKNGIRGLKKVVDSDENSSEDEDAAPARMQDSTNDTHEGVEKDQTTKDAAKDDASESEMSVLIDEPSPPKRKRQKKDAVDKSAKPSKPKKTKEAPELSSDDAEIKRLQGWLVKCGIRKLWGKELKPFETPKEKIRHLKGMLSEVGMDGRYSVEKARSIKERRELAADLEAVQEFGKRWGDDEDEGKTKGALRRRPQKKGTVVDRLSSDESVESGEDDEKKKKIDRRVADWGIDADLLGSDGGEETD